MRSSSSNNAITEKVSDPVRIGWFRQQFVRAQGLNDSLGLCLLTHFAPSLQLDTAQQQQVLEVLSSFTQGIGATLLPSAAESVSDFSVSWLESLQASQSLAKLMAQAQASRAQDSHTFLLRALRITSQLLAALQQLHELGVVHGNIHAHTVWVGLSLDGSERLHLTGSVPQEKLSRSVDGLSSVLPISIPNGAPDWLRCAAPECLLGQMPDQASDVFSVAMLIHRLLSGSWLVEGQTPWEISAAQAERLEQIEHKDGPLLQIEKRILPFFASATAENETGFLESLRQALCPERSDRCQLATLKRSVIALEQRVTKRLRELREGAEAELSDSWASIRHSRSSFARRSHPRSDAQPPSLIVKREKTVLDNGSNLAVVMESAVGQDQAQTTVKRRRTLELEELGGDAIDRSPATGPGDSNQKHTEQIEGASGNEPTDWIDWTDWIGAKPQDETALAVESIDRASPSVAMEEQVSAFSREALASTSAQSEPVEFNVAKPLRATDIANVEESLMSSQIDEQSTDTKAAEEQIEITETLDDLEVYLFDSDAEHLDHSEDAEVGFIDLESDEVVVETASNAPIATPAPAEAQAPLSSLNDTSTNKAHSSELLEMERHSDEITLDWPVSESDSGHSNRPGSWGGYRKEGSSLSELDYAPVDFSPTESTSGRQKNSDQHSIPATKATPENQELREPKFSTPDLNQTSSGFAAEDADEALPLPAPTGANDYQRTELNIEHSGLLSSNNLDRQLDGRSILTDAQDHEVEDLQPLSTIEDKTDPLDLTPLRVIVSAVELGSEESWEATTPNALEYSLNDETQRETSNGSNEPTVVEQGLDFFELHRMPLLAACSFIVTCLVLAILTQLT